MYGKSKEKTFSLRFEHPLPGILPPFFCLNHFLGKKVVRKTAPKVKRTKTIKEAVKDAKKTV